MISSAVMYQNPLFQTLGSEKKSNEKNLPKTVNYDFQASQYVPFDERENFSYEIYNALSLMNPKLADAYQKEDYCPFKHTFSINEDYVSLLLQIEKNKEHVKSKKFLDRNNKEISQLFEMSKVNTEQLLNSCVLFKPEKEDKARLEDFVIFLKNRIKLLDLAIEDLKNPLADSFKLYQEMVALNLDYSELIGETFLDGFKCEFVFLYFIEKYNFGKRKKTLAQKQEEEILARALLNAPVQKNVSRKKEVLSSNQAQKIETETIPKKPTQTKTPIKKESTLENNQMPQASLAKNSSQEKVSPPKPFKKQKKQEEEMTM